MNINFPENIYNRAKISKDSIFFFDMDGTLIDTDLANFLAYRQAIYTITGIEVDIMDYNLYKRFTRKQLRLHITNLTEIQYINIIKEKEFCQKNFTNATQLINSNVDILLTYYKTNTIILVTNGSKDRVRPILEYHNLISKFDYLFYRKNNKKEHNKYKNAISELGISPELIIAFENEEEEIRNAIKAGIKVINPKL